MKNLLMQDMKQTIRFFFMLMALMMGATSELWAQEPELTESDIVIDDGIEHGTVAFESVTNRKVTLTVTPGAGYYIKASDIVVEKLVKPGKANAPERRTPAFADVITGTMYSGSGRTEADIISSVKHPNSAEYEFTIPADYDGAYVTATFHLETEGDIIRITSSTSLGESPSMTAHYILVEDVSASVVNAFYSAGSFTGIFEGEAQADGSFPKITGLTHALFQTVNGGTVKNIVLDNVNISSGTNVGAICNEASGDTRIYNCGVLATSSIANTDEDGYTYLTACSSTVSGSNYVGSIVGLLDDNSRVINCFSYANVSGGTVGGIVGYNNVATTATNLKTMVMNCMFYGEVSGSSIAPIYNGKIITNVGNNTGVSNFNYFRLESAYIQNTDITKVYNCALGAETRFLQRFEFFRNLQNSHRELAAWWASTSTTPSPNVTKDEMAKWVLLPSQIGSSTPYPVIAKPGYYPSVVNIDAENATHATERNKGGKMGTLAVTIQMGSGGAHFGPPTGATITKSFLTLNITDKDPEHFNFNYYKVQLPYYNDVGTGNYTLGSDGNNKTSGRVVTGWKIVSITGGTPGTFTIGADASTDDNGNITVAPYNFADRYCTNKDLYGTNGNRVFSQGAYWDVPEGVTAITIEPYWAKAAYVADEYADVVYNEKMSTQYNVPNVGGGQIYTNGVSTFNDQFVYTNTLKSDGTIDKTAIANALASLSINTNYTVNDYAVVLVGNYHHVVSNSTAVSGSSPYTVTSVDLDGDDEPDYSLMLRNNGRNVWHPVKWDFINIPGLGMAQKSTGTTATGSYNLGIVCPKGWFETTNTSLFRVTQFEYSRYNSRTIAAPYILQGGVMEQWVTGQNDVNNNIDPKNTTYFHLGGNVWFKEFHRGTHQDNKGNTNHTPISVTGGDFDKFYLTGLYRADVTSYADNAECYINGGRFGEVAGVAMEGIGKAEGADNTGNIIWQIQNADIKEFYGGGLNADPLHRVEGNITTVITGGKIDLFCGGPKFGDMNAGKKVITQATGCEFGTFFGAGYGGSSYSRRAPSNIAKMINMPGTTNDKKTYNDWNAWVTAEYKQASSGTAFPGISTQFGYQFIPNSGNEDNVGRLFIEHVLFSLATTRDVTSTLTNCTITGNFYGGGNLGKVDGPVTSTLTDCTIKGSVFGAGYSASLPTVEVDNIGFSVEPSYYTDLGTYRIGVKSGTTTYTWAHGNAISIDTKKSILYTTEELDGLGAVTGNATLTINGTTTVAHSVYGGGEESEVGGTTEVNVTGGTIGTTNEGGAEYGNVYGGGKGKADEKLAGLVKGNTIVKISGTPTILHNVYGGGAYGSVGEFEYADATYHSEHPEVAIGAPKARMTGGTTNVTITGGTIGTNGENNGMVFGSSRGDVAKPDEGDEVDPNDRLAWVYETNVTIGTQSETRDLTTPLIRGSVYGSGENGHTFNDTHVKVHSGTIGIESGSPITNKETGYEYEGPRYPYRGNVYGGGCGTDQYSSGQTDSQGKEINDMFNFLAGIVLGNTNIEIDGGHIIHNVYGGGAMGSVGTYTSFADAAYVAAQAALDKKVPLGKPLVCKDGTGLCKVTISGGEIGTKNMKMDKTDGPDDFGHVFGGGRGNVLDPDIYKNVEICGYFGSTELTIKGKAFVRGSVYGGSESGHVLGNTHVVIGGNQEGDNECQIGGGDGVENAYSAEEWASESVNLKPTHHWDYIDDGDPYDMYAYEKGKYQTGKSAEGAYIVASDGHTFYGNVFAGGSGYYPFAPGEWLFSAGRVEGNATLEIMGGHILNNVYGGCEMSDVLGDVSVTMTGGTVGVPRTKGDILLNPAIGHIYGAGMGDKRIFFNTVTNVQNSNVTVSGGRVYGSVHGGGEDGHVLNKATTTISGNVVIGSVTDGTTSGFDGNVFGGGQGSPTALTAGTVGGNVELNIQGGTMHGSVYGGGRIASVGTYFALTTMKDPDNPEEYIPNPLYGKMQEGTDHGYITVNLKGGEIIQNVYGGCMGTRGMAAVDQVRFAVSKNITVNLNENVDDAVKGCIVKGSIFGCNNVNSSPQENVTVHIFKTQNALAPKIAGTVEGEGAIQPKVFGRFDVNAVYGGGNMAAYLPKGRGATADNYDGKNTDYSTHVIIDGCERTSIRQVYGGGNAASTPATEVTVNGTFEIDELFGGGNGADRITYNEGVSYQDNPGANVGFYAYDSKYDDSPYTKADREQFKYGTGMAAVNVFGGRINHAFGGSNTKGNVRETAITLLEEKTEANGETACCPFQVGEVYGGGKSAPMDADAKMLMQCIPGLRSAYGGAEEADIQGGVTLNITNGTFERVFGGNNLSGTIRGPIEVNIEETGCRPVIIGELYGGGNEAPYSVYGYHDDGSIIESGTTKAYKDPVVNVKSFTSIGEIYGGGYGSTATMVGDPTVNINVAADPDSEAQKKSYKDDQEQTKFYSDYAGETKTIADHRVTLPPHEKGKMGVINNVFGGGNAAPVKGNTQVNIGTTTEVYMLVNQELTAGTTDVSTFFTRTSGSGTTADPYVYSAPSAENGTCDANGKAVEGVTYYKKYDVVGADIRGNVYGGGNNAVVTGNANVNIGRKKEGN